MTAMRLMFKCSLREGDYRCTWLQTLTGEHPRQVHWRARSGAAADTIVQQRADCYNRNV